MPSVSKFDMQGNLLGSVDLKDEIFGVPANEALVHQAVVRHLANRRAGTADTKTRAEVSGGGKKAVAPEGHGAGPSRQHPLAHLAEGRRGVGTPSSQLPAVPQQEDAQAGHQGRPVRQGARATASP